MAKKTNEEPENLVLAHLREFRAAMEKRLDAIDKRLDAQTEALKGETVMARYTALGFDEQMSALTERVRALEARKR